jgi:UDP-N-acetylmuramoylalanine--D-glutamate ligase
MKVMDWTGWHVLVMGLGRFGGGVGAVRFLIERGASVRITDMRDATTLQPSLDALADLPFDMRLGAHAMADFTEADAVVVNPAINPHRNEYVQAAREAGARITSEIRLLIEALPGGPAQRVIGITGTAGKSTVTAMIGHVLNEYASDSGQAQEHESNKRAADNQLTHDMPRAFQIKPSAAVWIGGNLGGSLLPYLDQINAQDTLVLELSSFQLEHLALARWSPRVAVVTNFSANHLDWHGSLEGYKQAKQATLDHQQPGDVAILGHPVADWPTAPEVASAVVTEPLGGPLTVPGSHNRMNAALAAAASEAVGVPRGHTEEALAGFAGLAHRLQWVADVEGVRCFNDSKATTPEAAMLALDSFEPAQAHLLLGGYDKGSDLTQLAQHAAKHAAGIYTLGQTGPVLAEAIAAEPEHAPVQCCQTLDQAVHRALNAAQPGEIVLLSPGCASWDQFTNFEQRGAYFQQLVQSRAACP